MRKVLKMLRVIFCPRVVNALFVVTCIAAVMGADSAIVMIVQALLYALLVVFGE